MSFMKKNKYRARSLEIKGIYIYNKLENFLNDLEGEVIYIIGKIKKGSPTQIYGATANVDFLVIVEKI